MHERVEPNAGIPLAGYDFLGRGPRAAGSGGWARSGDLAYRCAKCGTMMRADRDDDFGCECGAMRLDADAGRFGSRLGDENVLVYRHVSR